MKKSSDFKKIHKIKYTYIDKSTKTWFFQNGEIIKTTKTGAKNVRKK